MGPGKASAMAAPLLALSLFLSLLPSPASAQLVLPHSDSEHALERAVGRTYAAAPYCCPGCDFGQADCCCGRHGLVPKIVTMRRTTTIRRVATVTSTSTRYTATSTTTVAATAAVALQRRSQSDAEPVIGDDGIEVSEAVEEHGPASERDIEEEMGTSPASGLGHLAKRHLCSACPQGAAVLPVTANVYKLANARSQYVFCCRPRKTRTTWMAAKTVVRARTARVWTTELAISTATKRQAIATVTGQLFIDNNANGKWDLGIDTPIANTPIQVVQNTSAVLQVARLRARDLNVLVENTTDEAGRFTFEGLFPEATHLTIVEAADQSKEFMPIIIDKDGKPLESSVVAAISSFNCTFPNVPSVFNPKEIMNHPELMSKIKNAILDMMGAVNHVWKTGGVDNTTAKAHLRPHTDVLKELGLDNDKCKFPNGGWQMSLKGACATPSMTNGIQTVVIELELVGNKTRCLTEKGEVARRIDVGAYFHVFKPVVKIDKLEEASNANGYHALLKQAAEFSHDDVFNCEIDGHERLDNKSRPALEDAAFAMAYAAYVRTGANGTCGPLTKFNSQNATFKVLSACSKDFEVESISATSHLMKMLVVVPCTKPGGPPEWAALMEGNSTIYPYFYDLFKHEKENITFSSSSKSSSHKKIKRVNEFTGPAIPLTSANKPAAPVAAPIVAASAPSADQSMWKRMSGGLARRGTDSNAACLNGICSFLMSDLDGAISKFPILNINIPGIGNLLSFFSPSKFITAHAGATICSMTFKGSSIATAASSTGALAWLSTVTVPVISDAAGWFDMFMGLPVDPNTYYVLGFYTTQVPGVTYPPTMPNIQVAAAMSFCTGDFLFSFAGLETTVSWPDPPLDLTVSLDAMGFSTGGKVYGSALGFVTSFWAPSGQQTIDINGQYYMTGTVSVDLGNIEVDPVVIQLSASGTVLVNADPANNGLAKTDVYLGIQVTAAPTLVLLGGQLNFDLSGMASANVILVFQYLSRTNYALALQATFATDLGGVFTALPEVGAIIGDALSPMFAGQQLNGEFDVWIANNQQSQEWGIRICMGGAGTLGVLGPIWTLLTTFIPTLPSGVNACFSIGGPTSGSGLPIKASFGALGKTMSMYFCKKDSHCGSGYQCNSGICSTIACPSAHPNMQGLLCYDSCKSGYTNVLGVCWENCRSGYVDVGVSCVQQVNSCPSGTENQGGLCYPVCNSGYSGVLGVCWQNCRSGYTDTGLFCTRGAVTRGKGGCCCHSELRCKGWKCSWKKSCCDNCDDGFKDTGCTCFQPADTYAKGSYTRNPTTALYFKQTYVIPAYPLSVKIQGLVW